MSGRKRKSRLRRSLRWAGSVAILSALLGLAARASEAALPIWAEVAVGAKLPASAELLELGKEVYQIRCAICHSRLGDGQGAAAPYYRMSMPRDFTRGIFKFRSTPQETMPTDEDLFRTVTVGFPQYGMPSFGYLSAQERWAVVHYLKTFSEAWGYRKAGTPIQIGPEPPATAASIARGRALFEKFECVKCHGPEGRGDGPASVDLTDHWGHRLVPKDFALGQAYFKSGGRARDLVRVFSTGIVGTPMPSYLDQLEAPENPKELWDLAHFVLDRSRKPPKAREQRRR